MAEPAGDEFELATVPELSGACGPVRVALFGVSVLRSTRTGGLRPVEAVSVDDGEGGVDSVTLVLFLRVRAMFACGSHVMKLKERLPRLIYLCRTCQEKLSEEAGEPHRFEFDASSLDLPPFRIQLEAPAVACPGCGRYNVQWSDEIAAQIEGAMVDALACLPNLRQSP